MWNLDKRGLFSFKSAYRLGMKLENSSLASFSNREYLSKMWKTFWKTKVLPKAKICCWKIYHDIIPTKANLCKKGIDTNLLLEKGGDNKASFMEQQGNKTYLVKVHSLLFVFFCS